jgi:hypothetical protein
MQEQIRYYITKSGEEPTVRSVKIALNPADHEFSVDPGLDAEDVRPPMRAEPKPKSGVQRLMNGAMRKRPHRR